MHTRRSWRVLLPLAGALFLACNISTVVPILPTPAPTVTPTPEATPTPSVTPPPEPAVGVPITVEGWQIAVTDIRQADSVSDFTQQWTPTEGYTFILVEVDYKNVDMLSNQFSNEYAALIDEDGGMHESDGGGFGSFSLCMGCLVWSYSEEGSFTFGFVVKEELIDQTWKLQYKGEPVVEFTVGQQPEYPYETEIGAGATVFPAICEGQPLQPANEQGWLVLRQWQEETNQSVQVLNANDLIATQTCSGVAFMDYHVAPDGASLVLLSPLQGWSDLIVVEPDGKVNSLVRNGRQIQAEFDPSGKYVVFTTFRLEQGAQEGEATEEGGDVQEKEALYLFDRAKQATKLLKEGTWLTFRFLPSGRLLAAGNFDEDGATTEVALGQPGEGDLAEITLPEDVNHYDLFGTSNPDLFLYQRGDYDNREWVIAGLDGSNSKSLSSSSGDTVSNIRLSPDDKFALLDVQGEGTDSVELLNLETSQSTTVVEEGTSFSFDFSPDGRYALVFATTSASGDNTEDQTTLYVIDTTDSSTVFQVEDAVKAFFSPDSTKLAYTTKKEDKIESFVITLGSQEPQTLGEWMLDGWYPLPSMADSG